MGLNVRLSVKIDPPDLFRWRASRLRERRGVMRQVGEYMIGQGKRRAPKGRGKLARSLAAFEVTNDRVTVGSNLPYAAIRQEGGTILPSTVKALAIPLLDTLRKRQLWPRDIDPKRELLQFVPIHGRGGVFGVLVNPEQPKSGRQRKARGALSGFPPGPLFALSRSVQQQGTPYLYFNDADIREINRLWRNWLQHRK